MPSVKICGVMDPETAFFAAQAGAKFIGVIFAKESKRRVDLETAKKIAAKGHEGGAKVIGVFVEQNGEEMQRIIDRANLDGAQLHGPTSRETHLELGDEIIRFYVCPVSEDGFTLEENHHGFEALKRERDYLLYDGIKPGSGIPFHWEALEPRRDFNFALAGGLTPQNVKEVILAKQPDIVDVASGVECPRYSKDRKLIEAFIQEAS